MSRTADRFNQNVVTVWAVGGRDKFGQPSFSAPVTIPATWKAGGSLRRDDSGNEFVPKTTYYLSADSAPKRGSYIARGNHDQIASPIGAPDVEIVRSFDDYDNTAFGRTVDIVAYSE